MIDTISVQNFKSIKSLVFHLGRFNVFVGENNSGKSSVLQAIQFAVGTAQTGKRIAVSREENSISFSAGANSFIYLPIRDFEALFYEKKFTQNVGAKIEFSEGEIKTEVELKRGKNRNISVKMLKSSLLDEIMDSKPYCVFTPGLSGIPLREEYKSISIVRKSATRGDSNFYLRNILLELKKNEIAWEEFIEKFNIFFPTYELHVEFDQDVDEEINCYVKIPNKVDLPIDALGTSALQILQILSYIYCFSPKIIILDEPDTHLHPNNQRRLIETLYEISVQKNLQVILSTHSRHILDEVSGFAKFFWMQNGELRREFEADDGSEIIDIVMSLGALDKTDFLVNNKLKWVICTEDAKVDKERMLYSVLEASGADLEECLVIPYNGCAKIESVVLLADFLKKNLPNVNILVHRDRDYLTDELVSEMKERFLSRGIFLWITEGTDVESIFINKDHIRYVNPKLGNDEALRIIQESIYNAKEHSIRKFVNYVANCSDKNDRGGRDYWKINKECESTYENNPIRYTHGKKALSYLKNALQTVLKKECKKLFVSSPYICQEELKKLFSTR